MLAFVGIAFLVARYVPQLRERESFVVFLGAVMFSAWFGGWGPGLASSLLSAFLNNFYVVEPPGEFTFNEQTIVTHISFILVAVMISYLTTQLTRAQEETSKQRQWFESILSSIGDAVIATDAEGKIQYVNTAAKRLLNIDPENIMGRNVEQILSAATGQKIGLQRNELMQRALAGDPALIAPMQGAVSRNGTELPIEYTEALIRDGQLAVLGLVLLVRDIREREEARKKIMEHQKNLQSLAAELSLAEERERRQIAVCLHDRIGQTLALSSIKLHELRPKIASPEISAELDELSLLLKDMLSETRSLTFELSPPILYEFGLEAALDWLCMHFQKSHGLECSFRQNGNPLPLPLDQRITLFQSVRELLTNVLKHANAHHASVAVDKVGENISVMVEDDGAGFDTAHVAASSLDSLGFGLFSIGERVRHLGGSMGIRSSPGKGAAVTLSLPVAAEISH
jgi:PAS domain S-box-containing protein